MKKIITLIVITFLILVGGIGYYFYLNNQSTEVKKGGIFNSVKNFLPFGNPSGEATPPNTNYGTSTPNTNTPKINIDKMFQISNTPTVGFVALDRVSTSSELVFNKTKNATTSTTTKQTEAFVRFIERATGNLFESKISTLEKTRILKETIPKVYEAYLNKNGTEFITRTLSGENIVTTYRKIKQNTTTSTTTASTPPVIEFVVSDTVTYPYNTDVLLAKGDSVFYTTKTLGGSTGFLTSFDNKKPSQIFTTQLREINASWEGGNFVEIFTKANSQFGGSSFIVDIKKKTLKENLTDMLGLVTNINFDGSHSLYNTNITDLSLGAKINSSTQAFYLQTKTLPEKCVWSKKNKSTIYCAVPYYVEKNNYPESWYQGRVFFEDSFWSINIETGSQQLIYRPSADGKDSPDAINLSLNEKENYLFFINKRDLTLWGLSL